MPSTKFSGPIEGPKDRESGDGVPKQVSTQAPASAVKHPDPNRK